MSSLTLSGRFADRLGSDVDVKVLDATSERVKRSL
jgi:hypothetical protein